MKKRLPLLILSIAASVILSGRLLAQEQVEMSIKVTKNGKVVQDTTYKFDDADDAKHVVKMIEGLSGDEPHMEHVTYNYTTSHTGSGHSRAMIFISEDGETTEIKELHGDSLVWVSEGEEHGEHVIVVKSDDGNTFDILIDENYEEGHKNKDEHVEVIVIKKHKKVKK